MSTDINAARKARIEAAALEYCKQRFGRKVVKIGEEIHRSIKWRPSFYLSKGPVIFAVEVEESLDGTIFKLSDNEIRQFAQPIAVCLACSLDVFQADAKQAKVKELKRNGIGLITVDESDGVATQIPCIPLAQHFSEEFLMEKLRDLPPRLKVAFRTAHESFTVNPGPGLQEASQIVEAIVDALALEAIKAGKLPSSAVNSGAADKIDALYDVFKQQRAAFGGARSFFKTYRNVTSHPARSAKEVMHRINVCRDGFFEAVRISRELSQAAKSLSYTLKLHLG